MGLKSMGIFLKNRFARLMSLLNSRSILSIVTGLLSVFRAICLERFNFIQGLQVNGTLTLKNGSFLSTVSCKYATQDWINGTRTQSAILPALVDSSWGSKTETLSILIAKADLPSVALNIGFRWTINISVESSAVLAGFTITKTHKNKRWGLPDWI